MKQHYCFYIDPKPNGTGAGELALDAVSVQDAWAEIKKLEPRAHRNGRVHLISVSNAADVAPVKNKIHE